MGCFATPYGLRCAGHCSTRAHAQQSCWALIRAGRNQGVTSSATTAKGNRRGSRASDTSTSCINRTGALALSPLIIRRSPLLKPSFAASAVLIIVAPLPLSSTARTADPPTCAETRRVSPVPTYSRSHSRWPAPKFQGREGSGSALASADRPMITPATTRSAQLSSVETYRSLHQESSSKARLQYLSSRGASLDIPATGGSRGFAALEWQKSSHHHDDHPRLRTTPPNNQLRQVITTACFPGTLSSEAAHELAYQL